ncbi:MAG: DUF3566 domain-containing protein [Candidatus Korobacteraceae bacterium]
MFRLRSIDVLSSAKILAVVQAVIGILIGFCFLLFGIAGAALAPSHQKLGMVGIIVLAVLMPVFYGVLGFVMGAVWAWVYNLAAQSIGGLELQLDAVPAAYLAPPPAAGA